MHVKGYAAPATKAAAEKAHLLIEQAEAIGEPPEDPLLLFSVLYGDWTANLAAFNGNALRELARQFLALAKRQSAAIPLMVGNFMYGTSLMSTGELAEGRAHLDVAIAHYDPIAHRSLATRFGQDVRTAGLTRRSMALWALGYPDAALADIDKALGDAREIGQAATLFFPLLGGWFINLNCGNYGAATAFVDELAKLADEKGVPLWKAVAMLSRGSLHSVNGNASDSVEITTRGLVAARSTGATMSQSPSLARLAIAYAQLGKFDDAWRSVQEAIALVEKTGERFWEAEVNRFAGETTLMFRKPNLEKAQYYFERALTIARQQQAKSLELRASMSLARLWRDQGKRQQALELLAPVYGWFTEGFDTHDLKEAKVLLEELAA
jgi:predicted ATPase